ncbi:gag-pol polyprotein [Trichonephila clavata]|uniref:Gag-pol polyprotein n=1 Tax=Trichonephila clavata TaxID=2740835 RepID=A0A8X6GAS6_TRICU|nr:gag-pol polyprotein [Trichonephila clavata]
MPNECDSNQISHVAVKPPPFWKHNPALCDLVLKPPENGKYDALKKRLIEVHSESEDSKIRILFQGLELGDQRPSQLLTRMRSLAGDNVGINSAAATSKNKTAQLEQQIAQLTQQVSELTSFVKRSRSPARNSNHFRNRTEAQTPLNKLFNKISDSCSPRQLRHLDFISQFRTHIRHVSGSDNSVADALSRINALNLSTTDLQHLADSQTKYKELKTLISSNDLSIKLKPLKMGNALEIFCDVSREKLRLYVPVELRFEVFRSSP